MFGIVAVSALAYVLCDILHEAGHLAATFLPLGVNAVSISTVAVSTTRSSPIVAAAGVIVNLILGLALPLALTQRFSASWRYFLWLLGTVSLMNASGYLIYSAALGSGDLAVVFNAFSAPTLWRPLSALVGLASYAATVRISAKVLRDLVNSRVFPSSSIERRCQVPYWSGGLLITAGALFNPVSHLLVLTSGAAVGFGAMVGLLLLPRLLGDLQESAAAPSEPPAIGWRWHLAGALAAIVFVGLFGPGLSLTRGSLSTAPNPSRGAGGDKPLPYKAGGIFRPKPIIASARRR